MGVTGGASVRAASEAPSGIRTHGAPASPSWDARSDGARLLLLLLITTIIITITTAIIIIIIIIISITITTLLLIIIIMTSIILILILAARAGAWRPDQARHGVEAGPPASAASARSAPKRGTPKVMTQRLRRAHKSNQGQTIQKAEQSGMASLRSPRGRFSA